MTDEQLLLLNNLIYQDKLTGAYSDLVKDRCENITISNIIKFDWDSTPDMTSDEWEDIRKEVESDPEILDLKVEDLYYDSNTGEVNLCLVNPLTNDAYVVFRGTGGGEWTDNFEGGYLSDTKQQQKALKWLDDLPEFHSLTVSGHSKGGNKAQYITYLSDKVDRCVSFDGQGFSAEFIEKYWAEIQLNKDKITAYALDSDFVNILLYSIDLGDNRKYIKANPTNVDGFAENHSPNAFLNIIKNEDKQNPIMTYLHQFTLYIMNDAPDSEKRIMLDYLGRCIGTFYKDNAKSALDYASETGNLEGLILVLSYLIKYAQTSNLDGKTVTSMLSSFNINLEVSDVMMTIIRGSSEVLTSDELDGKASRYVLHKGLDVAQPIIEIYKLFDKEGYDKTIGIMVAMGFSTKEAEQIINGVLEKTSKLEANVNDFKEKEVKTGEIRDFSNRYVAEIENIISSFDSYGFSDISNWKSYSGEEWYIPAIDGLYEKIKSYEDEVNYKNKCCKSKITELFRIEGDIDIKYQNRISDVVSNLQTIEKRLKNLTLETSISRMVTPNISVFGSAFSSKNNKR